MNAVNPEFITKLFSVTAAIPFNKLLGLELDTLNESQVQMHFPMKKELVGNYLFGILHGGVISSVLDMVGGMVCMSAAIYKHKDKTEQEIVNIVSKCGTIDLQVNFIRPGRGDLFIAKAWIVRCGNHISFARMELTNQDNTLIATGTGTYLLK